jgi:hypothetical protein
VATTSSEMPIFAIEPLQQNKLSRLNEESETHRAQCLQQKFFFYCQDQKLKPSHSDNSSLKLQENETSIVTKVKARDQ